MHDIKTITGSVTFHWSRLWAASPKIKQVKIYQTEDISYFAMQKPYGNALDNYFPKINMEFSSHKSDETRGENRSNANCLL